MGGAAFGTGLTHIFALQVLIKACCGQSTEIMLKRDVKVVHQRRNMTSTDIENHPCWVQFLASEKVSPCRNGQMEQNFLIVLIFQNFRQALQGMSMPKILE